MTVSSARASLQRWLVVYNYPTKTWDSCGHTLEREASYDRELNDLYQATAATREEAEKRAQKQRQQEAALTPRQRELLGSLVAEALQELATHGTDPLRTSTEIPSDEHRACRGLMARGLVAVVTDVPDPTTGGTHLEVSLTWAGLNGRFRNPEKMQAARRQRQALEKITPPPAPTRRRLRS
jgi:hypothetical protein